MRFFWPPLPQMVTYPVVEIQSIISQLRFIQNEVNEAGYDRNIKILEILGNLVFIIKRFELPILLGDSYSSTSTNSVFPSSQVKYTDRRLTSRSDSVSSGRSSSPTVCTLGSGKVSDVLTEAESHGRWSKTDVQDQESVRIGDYKFESDVQSRSVLMKINKVSEFDAKNALTKLGLKFALFRDGHWIFVKMPYLQARDISQNATKLKIRGKEIELDTDLIHNVVTANIFPITGKPFPFESDQEIFDLVPSAWGLIDVKSYMKCGLKGFNLQFIDHLYAKHFVHSPPAELMKSSLFVKLHFGYRSVMLHGKPAPVFPLAYSIQSDLGIVTSKAIAGLFQDYGMDVFHVQPNTPAAKAGVIFFEDLSSSNMFLKRTEVRSSLGIVRLDKNHRFYHMHQKSSFLNRHGFEDFS